jgi:hypothetical protein
MTDFRGRKSLFDSKPFTLTCEQVQQILQQKVNNPNQTIPNLAEAILHVAICESCSVLLTSRKFPPST